MKRTTKKLLLDLLATVLLLSAGCLLGMLWFATDTSLEAKIGVSCVTSLGIVLAFLYIRNQDAFCDINDKDLKNLYQ